MSRNDSRLGGENTSPGDANFPVTEVEDTQNNTTQPLSFSVPTEQVELPSQGRYYPENHPLHNAETIEIKFMTAKEESNNGEAFAKCHCQQDDRPTASSNWR